MAATTYHHEKWQAPDNDDEVLDVVAIQQERKVDTQYLTPIVDKSKLCQFNFQCFCFLKVFVSSSISNPGVEDGFVQFQLRCPLLDCVFCASDLFF